MDQKINVLIVEPGKEPRPATVEDTLEAFQQIVGGPIEAGCYLPQRVMLICNGEGKSMGLMPNRRTLRTAGTSSLEPSCCAVSRGSVSPPCLTGSGKCSRTISPCPLRREAAASDSPISAPTSGRAALEPV